MAEIITPEAFSKMLKKFDDNMKDLTGVSIPEVSNIDVPGLGSIITVIMRIIEMGLTTSFEPIVKLVEIVKDLKTLPDKLIQFISEWDSVFKDPVTFIINKILEPLIKYIVLPLPSVKILIQVLMGQISLSDVDWSKKENLLLPPKFLALPDYEERLKVISSGPKFITSMMGFVLIPLKVIIAFFKAFISKLVDALNITKIVVFIKEWINPVEGLMKMLGEIFGTVIGGVASSLFSMDKSSIEDIIKMVKDNFSINIVKSFKTIFNDPKTPPPLKMIQGFFSMMAAMIEMIIGFIFQIPSLIFS